MFKLKLLLSKIFCDLSSKNIFISSLFKFCDLLRILGSNKSANLSLIDRRKVKYVSPFKVVKSYQN